MQPVEVTAHTDTAAMPQSWPPTCLPNRGLTWGPPTSHGGGHVQAYSSYSDLVLATPPVGGDPSPTHACLSLFPTQYGFAPDTQYNIVTSDHKRSLQQPDWPLSPTISLSEMTDHAVPGDEYLT